MHEYGRSRSDGATAARSLPAPDPTSRFRDAIHPTTKVHAHRIARGRPRIYRLDLATRSISSFFLMAYELDDPFAAFMISSARHSAMVLMLRKEASRAPVVRR